MAHWKYNFVIFRSRKNLTFELQVGVCVNTAKNDFLLSICLVFQYKYVNISKSREAKQLKSWFSKNVTKLKEFLLIKIMLSS